MVNKIFFEECLKELALLLGNEVEAQSILFMWRSMASIYGDGAPNIFTESHRKTDAQRLTDLRLTLDHIEGLIPLLDDRLSWVTACDMPGMFDGPEVAEENEVRIAALKASLVVLREDVALTIKKLPPVARGRKLELTPRVMLTIRLISRLKEAGLPTGTGERSKMVRAVRVCWDAIGFDGDPRDLMRSLEKRRAQMGASS